MSRGTWLKALVLGTALSGFMGGSFEGPGLDRLIRTVCPPLRFPETASNTLRCTTSSTPTPDGIVAQIQGHTNAISTAGSGTGVRHANNLHGLNKMKYYTGYHFALDVFLESGWPKLMKPTGRASCQYLRPSDFEGSTPQRAGDFVIRLRGLLDLIEVHPLVLCMRLCDASGSEDQAWQAAFTQRSRVGAVRNARHLGNLARDAPRRVPRSRSSLRPDRSGESAGILTRGVKTRPSRSPSRSRSLLHTRCTEQGCRLDHSDDPLRPRTSREQR